MAFRFFINADQCLNMNHFKFFFYKKISRHEFHLTPEVYIGEGSGLSFQKTAAAIRMYLDRFPYHVDDYQIIIAMRSDYKNNVTVWRETLLSRLLDIDFGLRQSNILIRSGNTTEVAVNLIMLYETTAIRDLHKLDTPYMSHERLMQDCILLLREIGVPAGKENDLSALQEAWKSYENLHREQYLRMPRMADGKTPADALYVFITTLLKQYESDQQEITGLQGTMQVSIFRALQKVLDGYQVFELLTDTQNRDKDINALLRIVEFATTDFDIAQGMENVPRLSTLCQAHWNKICEMDDSEIQNRYAEMLYTYRSRLTDYISNESLSVQYSDQKYALPECSIPADNDISIDQNSFENNNTITQAQDVPKNVLKTFRKSHPPVKTLQQKWDTIYTQLHSAFTQLNDSLHQYTSALSHMYIDELQKRKEEERLWQQRSYTEDEHTKQDISALVSKEKELLERMNQPQMTPSLRFQDQLNMETALEQENIQITHYIKCMQSVSGKNFLLLILLLIGMIALPYIFLQPYNLTSGESVLYFLMYLTASAVLMCCTWALPVQYYRKRIHRCLDTLEKEMDTYIAGYFDRAKQFYTYINLTNQLDYIERHLRVKKRAVQTSNRLASARTWHINQARLHLKNLEFFNGLIDTYNPSAETDTLDSDGILNIPDISIDHVDDVIDNKLYWPQT